MAQFSDAILDIRWQQDMVPERTPPEQVAHVIRRHAVDDRQWHKPPDKAPNDRYFAISRSTRYVPGAVVAFAVLDGAAAVEPHPLVIEEMGVASGLPSQKETYPGLFALLLGGVVAHAEGNGWLRAAPDDAPVRVKSPAPSEAGTEAMLALGFERDEAALEFRASLATVRQAFTEFVMRRA